MINKTLDTHQISNNLQFSNIGGWQHFQILKNTLR